MQTPEQITESKIKDAERQRDLAVKALDMLNDRNNPKPEVADPSAL